MHFHDYYRNSRVPTVGLENAPNLIKTHIIGEKVFISFT